MYFPLTMWSVWSLNKSKSFSDSEQIHLTLEKVGVVVGFWTDPLQAPLSDLSLLS